ncbi:MAG TPA: quinate 5-dehydrogenase [Clostridiales bacterium]|nr:quinate 5-dehydrogenase [Clostridiales bacterium]
MKRIVSISLGSSQRDKKVELELLGQPFSIERVGTDGDVGRAVRMLKELDGRVTAFGIGGIDFSVRSSKRHWPLRDAIRLAHTPQKTPVVDGGGVKDALERQIVFDLEPVYGIPVKGRRVLVASGAARYAMAEAFVQAGADCIFGDLMFVLGLPVKIRTLAGLDRAVRLIAPVASRLPISLLYPTGKAQHRSTPRFPDVYAWADFLTGDYHFLHRHLPDRIDRKVVFTNTVTATDVDELRARGAGWLITSSPEMNGRSFAANVVEAMLVALSGKRPEELTREDYLELFSRAGLRPRVERLN